MRKNVPDRLISNIFFPNGTLNEKEQWFQYEVEYYLNEESAQPWLEDGVKVTCFFEQWKRLKPHLNSVFESRDKQAVVDPMKKGLELFLTSLFWANNQPVSFKKHAIKCLSVKPVNVIERLDFILNRPYLFHSFIQLNELIEELEKQYMKKLALKNIKNK